MAMAHQSGMGEDSMGGGPPRPMSSLGIPTELLNLKMPGKPAVDSWPINQVARNAPDPVDPEFERPRKGGYFGAADNFNMTLKTGINKLPIRAPVSEPTEGAVPNEVRRIQRFIEVEFRKRGCVLENYSKDRIGIFREALREVGRTFKSWAPLLKHIEREHEAYTQTLEQYSVDVDTLQLRLTELEGDYSHKFKLMKNEQLEGRSAEKAAALKELTEAKGEISKLEEDMQYLQRDVDRHKLITQDLHVRLRSSEEQNLLVIKAYRDQVDGVKDVMKASGATTCAEVVTKFESMVHVQAMWDMEARLDAEKKEHSVTSRAMYENKGVLNRTLTDFEDLTGQHMKVVKEMDRLLAWFPALFPEAERLSFKRGKVVILHDVRKEGSRFAPGDTLVTEPSAPSSPTLQPSGALLPTLARSLSQQKDKDEDGPAIPGNEISVLGTMRSAMAVLRMAMDQHQAAVRTLQLRHDTARDELLQRQEYETPQPWKQAEYLEGLGTGDQVPTPLHCEGKVKNRQLPRAILDKAIKTLLKTAHAEEAAARAKGLSEQHTTEKWWTMLHDYSATLNATEPLKVEWNYSFIDGLRRFQGSFQMRCMLLVLDEGLDVAVFTSISAVISQLAETVGAAAKEGKDKGKIPRSDLLKHVDKFFKPRTGKGGSGNLRTPEQLSELSVDLLYDEQAGTWGVTGNDVEVKHLFGEGKEGVRSNLVEKIAKHHLIERLRFIHDILRRVEWYRTDAANLTSAKTLFSCLRRVDPDKPADQVLNPKT
ncbi:hypothetical protein T484DRAFT_2926268 [Baffinella frigidus]|nr:hypothetical protein T484DRAFT_2926268 [Cryptophyta sp. CCMP2293]